MTEVYEHTVVLAKPDAVRRGLVGELISRIERTGLKLVACKMVQADKDLVLKHLPCTDEWRAGMGNKTLENFAKYNMNAMAEMGTDNPAEIGMQIQGWLVDYLTSGPVMAMAFYGIHAIDMVRKIIGSTIPNKADMGTFRGDYSVDSSSLANVEKRAIRNLVHASGDRSEAENEISTWFSPEEIHDYKAFSDNYWL